MAELTRRDVLRTAAGAAAALPLLGAPAVSSAAPRRFRGGSFGEGVLSGDPSSRGITLATRLHGAEGRGSLLLEVARDSGFRRTVLRTQVETNEALGHAVKVRVSGLRPHRRYWYRFATRRADSAVGRFRTAPPADSREPVRFGVFCGQEYSFGYFNAHARLAEEDLDFVLNLGGYVYADAVFRGTAAVRPLDGPDVAATLPEFRSRYREYRADRDLRRMHAAHAMLSCWDDGEVRRGYAGRAPARSPYAFDEKSVAYRAWFESMPHYPKQRGTARTYHSARFGRALNMVLLDVRQERDPAPCESNGDPECAERGTARLLGDGQRRFARSRLENARTEWSVVASPVPVAEIRGGENRFRGFDSWQGFLQDRRALIESLGAMPGDPVILSGNVRRFFAADVEGPSGQSVAPEFGCGSVSMATDAQLAAVNGEPGAGTPREPAVSEEERQAFLDDNPTFVHHDPLRHGYAVCEARTTTFSVRFRKLQTTARRSTALAEGEQWTLQPGHRVVPGLPT